MRVLEAPLQTGAEEHGTLRDRGGPRGRRGRDRGYVWAALGGWHRFAHPFRPASAPVPALAGRTELRPPRPSRPSLLARRPGVRPQHAQPLGPLLFVLVRPLVFAPVGDAGPRAAAALRLGLGGPRRGTGPLREPGELGLRVPGQQQQRLRARGRLGVPGRRVPARLRAAQRPRGRAPVCQSDAAAAGEPGPGAAGLAPPRAPADAQPAGEPGGQRAPAPGLQRAVRPAGGAAGRLRGAGQELPQPGPAGPRPQPRAHLPADARAAPGLAPLAQDPGAVQRRQLAFRARLQPVADAEHRLPSHQEEAVQLRAAAHRGVLNSGWAGGRSAPRQAETNRTLRGARTGGARRKGQKPPRSGGGWRWGRCFLGRSPTSVQGAPLEHCSMEQRPRGPAGPGWMCM